MEKFWPGAAWPTDHKRFLMDEMNMNCNQNQR